MTKRTSVADGVETWQEIIAAVDQNDNLNNHNDTATNNISPMNNEINEKGSNKSEEGVELRQDGTTYSDDHSFASAELLPPPCPKSIKLTTLAGKEVEVDSRMIPLMGQFISALVVMIATAVSFQSTSMKHAYSISMAVVAMIFGLFGMAILYKEKNRYIPRDLLPCIEGQQMTYLTVLAFFLCLWWTIGVSILTFHGPFLATSNGYFACWAGFVFATMGFVTDVDACRHQIRGTEGYKNMLLVVCAILLGALPKYLGPNGFPNNGSSIYNMNQGEAIFALVIVLITMILYLVVKASTSCASCSSHNQKVHDVIHKIYMWEVMSLFWLIMACVVTFRGPFALVTGNGFFASWAGLCLCIAISMTTRRESSKLTTTQSTDDEEDEDETETAENKDQPDNQNKTDANDSTEEEEMEFP